MNWRRRRSKAPSPAAPAAETAPVEEPCIPCGDKRGVRQFSLNRPLPSVITDADVPKHAERMRFTVVDDHVVLYDSVLGVSHVLNASAALIWASIDDETAVGTIIDDIHAAVEADRPRVAGDVATTLQTFAAAGIVELSNRAGAAGDDDVASEAPPPDPAPPADGPHPALTGAAWIATIGPVRALDAAVTVRTDSAAVATALPSILDSLPRVPTDDPGAEGATTISVVEATDGEGPQWLLFVGDELRFATPVIDQVLPALATELNLLAIDQPNGRLLLHAGAIERDGEVIVIAGDSGRGKSTLTARLVQRGYAYVTDEVVAIDPETLHVQPYPKSLSLSGSSAALLGLSAAGGDASAAKEAIRPTELGRVSGGGEAACLIVLTGAEPAQHSPAGTPAAVDALLALLGVTFSPSLQDPSALDALQALSRTLPMHELARGDLDEMVDAIERAPRRRADVTR